jgi:DNA-binding NarL/FixJ family response regulator
LFRKLNRVQIPGDIAMSKKIKLLIACGDSLSCLALCELLCKEKDFIVDCKTRELETETVADTILWFKNSDPDILFICSHFLIRKGTEIIAKITKERMRAKIAIFNSHFTEEQELLLAKEGVIGILSSDLEPPTLLKALRKIHAGELWFRRELIHSLIGNVRLDFHNMKESGDGNPQLTEKELEVLSLIANDYKNKEISSKLCVSELTVKTHINNIFKKLNVNNRMQAIFYAKKHFLHSKYI